MSSCDYCSRDYPLEHTILVKAGSACKRCCSWACARDMCAAMAIEGG